MTVSLDSPLSGGAGEGRQRLQRAAARAVGFIGKMARNPLTAIGGGIIFLLLVVAIFAPLIAPYNPLVQDLNSALVAPNAQHWFGTDEFGRDIFSRLQHGLLQRQPVVGAPCAGARQQGLHLADWYPFFHPVEDLQRLLDVVIAVLTVTTIGAQRLEQAIAALPGAKRGRIYPA